MFDIDETTTATPSITDLVNNPAKAKARAAKVTQSATTKKTPAKAQKAAAPTTKKAAAPKTKTAKPVVAKSDVAKSPITGKKVTSAWASMTDEQRKAKYAYNREHAAAKRKAAKITRKTAATRKGR